MNETKFCHHCGETIAKQAEICPKCGVRQMAAPFSLGATTVSGKSRIAAALLALFLGGLGVHRFYLGKWLSGLIYLFFCWTFIPAFVSFIEAILFLVMSDETFAAKYS